MLDLLYFDHAHVEPHLCFTGTLKDGKTRVGGISRAFNRLGTTTRLRRFTKRNKEVANAGLKNPICFSGNRAGMDDETGLKNCATGRTHPLHRRETQGEYRDGAAQQPRESQGLHVRPHGLGRGLARHHLLFGLLYDIYHMHGRRGMSSGRSATITSIYSTTTPAATRAGTRSTRRGVVRPATARDPRDRRKGHVGQEFIRREDKLASLEQGVRICDV